MKKTLVAILGLALLAALAFLVPHSAAQKPLCPKCNVILISIDTLGAKHTGVYDATLDTTPFMKQLAQTRGIVFEHAYVNAPWTLPSHTAMLTGMYPWDLGVWTFFDALPKKAVTLAEMMKKSGYETAGFARGAFIHPLWQFDQGFDVFDTGLAESTWKDLPELFVTSVGWAEQKHGAPFFMFVRPFEVHDPYGVPGTAGAVTIHEIVAANKRPGGATPEETAHFLSMYEKNIETTDSALRDFFTALDSSGLSKNTVVIITADHGEEFNEHGTVGLHGDTLYAELIHIPLIVVLPQGKPARIQASVEEKSIPATIMELVGERPPENIGPSLVPLINGRDAADRMVLSQTALDRALVLGQIEKGYAMGDHPETIKTAERTGPYGKPHMVSALMGAWHLIRNADGSMELYNLYKDPTEKNNLVNSENTFSKADQDIVKKLISSIAKAP